METSEKVLGNIKDAELGSGSRNIPSGCMISFVCREAIPLGELVSILVEDKPYYFEVKTHKIENKIWLLIEAKQTGYHGSKFETRKGFDIRSLLDLEVMAVTDPEIKKQVQKEASYC